MNGDGETFNGDYEDAGGYVFLTAPCFRCRTLVTCNPHLVPNIGGEVICEPCVRAIQQLQRERGLALWPDPLPGAYEPMPAREL